MVPAVLLVYKLAVNVRATSTMTVFMLASDLVEFLKENLTLWILEVQSALAHRVEDGSVAILFHVLSFPLTALKCRSQRMGVFSVNG